MGQTDLAVLGSGKGRVATFAQNTQHYIQKHAEHYIWQKTEYYIQKTPPLPRCNVLHIVLKGKKHKFDKKLQALNLSGCLHLHPGPKKTVANVATSP